MIPSLRLELADIWRVVGYCIHDILFLLKSGVYTSRHPCRWLCFGHYCESPLAISSSRSNLLYARVAFGIVGLSGNEPSVCDWRYGSGFAIASIVLAIESPTGPSFLKLSGNLLVASGLWYLLEDFG
jgi:hypothetical protein